jgi:hypothetical protein
MIKTLAVLVSFCFLFFEVKSQTGKNEIILNILKAQKEYLNSNIKEKERSKYLSLLHFANVIHPKVIDEIQKLNTSFPANGQGVNILEGFNGYNSISGVIWQSDCVYYNFNYAADKELKVLQCSLIQLNDTTKTIVQNFANWSNETFATNGQALGTPTDHPFFLASKYSENAVQTIGFYFQ